MDQTCYRFECLNHGKNVERFMSAFEGNDQDYSYNSMTLFEQDNGNNRNNEGFGTKIKNNLFKFGNAVKNKTVSGYHYV